MVSPLIWSNITTAAVCVYPARVADAVKALRAAGCKIPVASVATGFPAGQTALKTRLEEIRLAVEDGAKEIDIVINRTLVLTGQWEGECAQSRDKTRILNSRKTVLVLAVDTLPCFGCCTEALSTASRSSVKNQRASLLAPPVCIRVI
uniref:Uncharacterized protein n=1 Tax=Sphaerodactylus townsendi TaxID=933632 RepID=A0ACB8FMD5_9SAUR